VTVAKKHLGVLGLRMSTIKLWYVGLPQNKLFIKPVKTKFMTGRLKLRAVSRLTFLLINVGFHRHTDV
jgi:hypothetical protein